VSTGGSNVAGQDFGEYFHWGSIVEDTPGSVVEFAGDGVEVGLVVGKKGRGRRAAKLGGDVVDEDGQGALCAVCDVLGRALAAADACLRSWLMPGTVGVGGRGQSAGRMRTSAACLESTLSASMICVMSEDAVAWPGTVRSACSARRPSPLVWAILGDHCRS
jgi:hypothetical protein